MPQLSSFLLAFQSLTLDLFGLLALVRPAKIEWGNLTNEQSHVVGTVALSLGIAYITTAFQSRRARHNFLLAAAPMRWVAGMLFWRDGRRGTALWDGLNGVVNILVVLWERSA